MCAAYVFWLGYDVTGWPNSSIERGFGVAWEREGLRIIVLEFTLCLKLISLACVVMLAL